MYRLNMFKSSFELAAKHLDKSAYHSLWNAPATLDALHRDAHGRPTYLLHDGPPYANGHLHLGHFVNKTLKDALLKYKRLEGFFAPFVPGFDCHGLPVELEVEKQGVTKADPAAFVAACRRYAQSQVELQTAEFQAFGVSADWARPYLTMEPRFEAAAARYFARMPQRVSRLRPVHWCAHCGSSLAETEVEYRPKSSHSLDVLFALLDDQGRHDGHTYLQVWTTTPYTLPANKAVGYHPGFDYVAVTDAASGRTLVRLRQVGDDGAPLVNLAGRRALSPWMQESVPLLPADYVTATGTGLVHLAPAFGMDDFRVCETHGVAVQAYLDDQGRFLNGELQGLGLAEASAAVLQRLAERGLVHALSTVQHEYPHCWRHKKPLFFKASQEWFLDLAEVGPKALASLEAVSFTPAGGRERLSAMLKSRTSWCLSRNRLWGTPLVDDANEEAVLDQVAHQGVEAWQAAGPRRTLDVWFDSGVTHALVMQERFGRTADVYLEGSDQHRGWFQSSLLTSVSLTGVAPYKELVTHGFVVDEKGQKYSKSSGNYVPLDKLFEQHSPDVLRLWALSQDYTHDLKMSKESLARTVERYRKLRNTLRFCLQNLADYTVVDRVEVTLPLHRHQLSEMARALEETRAAADRHDFAAAVSCVLLFCEATSADYFTALKDTLYCDAPGSPRRRQAQTMLATLLDFLLRVLMPVLPYTVEEVFQLVREPLGYEAPCSLLLTLEGLEWPQARPLFDEAWRELKREVNRYVEAQRDETLKSAAQLELEVSAPQEVDEATLCDFFGAAGVRLARADDYRVSARRTLKPFCARCRRHEGTAGSGLCRRCESVETGCAQATSAGAAG